MMSFQSSENGQQDSQMCYHSFSLHSGSGKCSRFPFSAMQRVGIRVLGTACGVPEGYRAPLELYNYFMYFIF